MRNRFQRYLAAIAASLLAGCAIAPGALHVGDVFGLFVVVFWVGLPLLLLGTLVYQSVRSSIAAKRKQRAARRHSYDPTEPMPLS